MLATALRTPHSFTRRKTALSRIMRTHSSDTSMAAILAAASGTVDAATTFALNMGITLGSIALCKQDVAPVYCHQAGLCNRLKAGKHGVEGYVASGYPKGKEEPLECHNGNERSPEFRGGWYEVEP